MTLPNCGHTLIGLFHKISQFTGGKEPVTLHPGHKRPFSLTQFFQSKISQLSAITFHQPEESAESIIFGRIPGPVCPREKKTAYNLYLFRVDVVG